MLNENMIGTDLRVGVIGCGAIGGAVCRALIRGIPGLKLTAVMSSQKQKAADFVRLLSCEDEEILACESSAELAQHSDVIVEAAPAYTFRTNVEPLIECGKRVVTVSAGALFENFDLVSLARDRGAKIIVPSGALLGLDAVAAVTEGSVEMIHMETRKPPNGLAGAPYLANSDIELEGLQERVRIFTGTAAEAIKGFPANLNVAVALGLAGPGPEKVSLELWVDPDIRFNIHKIRVVSDSALMEMEIQNIPTENPKTGRITALSIIATLRKLTAPLQVGV